MSRKIQSRRSNQKKRRNSRKHRKTLRCETLEPRMMLNADMGDLSVLNDEFNDSSTIEEWQLISDTEGWNAQHFETFDIDQTNPGALTIEPQTSTWYQDYQGDLAFKEVTGDFVVTTHVTINDRDDIGGSDNDDIPNDSTFSLGGVMLRTPRDITDATTEWTPGGANFVFLSLGHGNDGVSMSLESKNTTNSNSELELIPINSTNAELRVERSGDLVTTMYRLEGDVEWQIAANFDRPDMPETLQVGLVGYTDYEKTSTFQPFYANSHTLIDTTENAANSSNPGMAYDPDVQVSFDYIHFERQQAPEPETPVVVTTEVAVVNASFEDIAGEVPFNEFTFGPLPGWDLYDPGGITSGGDGPEFFIGTLTPSEVAGEPGVIQNFPGGASDGDRVAISFNFDGTGDSGEYGLEQTLVETLQANTIYTLHVDIGNIATGTAQSGQVFFLEGLPGYRVELLAGGVVVASDDNSLAGSINEGEFGLSTITFDSGVVHPQLGQALGIRLVNLNQTAGVPAGNDLEVDFDNVRLTATSAVAFALIGDQQLHFSDTLAIDLESEIPGGLAVTYAVEIVGAELWNLDQQLGLNAGGYTQDGATLYYEEYQNYGVKWLQSDVAGWMFLASDGTLHEWQGSMETSPEVASLGEEVFADPSLLHDPLNIGTASLDGNTLTFFLADGFLGTFEVSVTKTAGQLTATEIFSVEVSNIGPVIPTIDSQTLVSGDVLLIDLPTADSDGDTIVYEVEVIENIAADLREEFAIEADASLVAADYGYNYLGQQERWVQSSLGWMFITTEGSVHRWSGAYASSPEVARLDIRYHQDPSLLVNAQHVDVSTRVTAGQFELSVLDGYLGELNIRLTATDGMESVQQSFSLEITASAWAGLVDDLFGDDDFQIAIIDG